MPKRKGRHGGGKGRRGGKRRGGGRGGYRRAVGHSVTKSKTQIAPDEFDVTLKFRTQGSITDGAAALRYKEFTPNSAYDVDPAFGSTETYGFDEYAALYSYYRVIGYSYRLTVTNALALPVTCYVTNTNIQVSGAGSRWDLYSTNPHSQTKVLAALGSYPSTVTFKGRHSVAQILGSGAVETDDNFRSLTTASPADLIWLAFAVENLYANTTVNFAYQIDIKMRVRFYAREVDLSLGGLSRRVSEHLTTRAIWNQKKWEKERLFLEGRVKAGDQHSVKLLEDHMLLQESVEKMVKQSATVTQIADQLAKEMDVFEKKEKQEDVNAESSDDSDSDEEELDQEVSGGKANQKLKEKVEKANTDVKKAIGADGVDVRVKVQGLHKKEKRQ